MYIQFCKKLSTEDFSDYYFALFIVTCIVECNLHLRATD
jgi:hypothetical protein